MIEWRDVLGFEDTYKVSSDGLLFNKKTGNFVKGTKYSNGYIVVCLSRKGIVERRTLHKVVAEAFFGKRPHGYHIDHINGNREDNSALNLRFLTPYENIKATVKRDNQAKGSKNGQSKLTEAMVDEIRAAKVSRGRYWGAKEYAKKFGVNESSIVRAASGKSFKHTANAIRIHKE